MRPSSVGITQDFPKRIMETVVVVPWSLIRLPTTLHLAHTSQKKNLLERRHVRLILYSYRSQWYSFLAVAQYNKSWLEPDKNDDQLG